MVTTIRKVTGGDYPFYEFACLSTDTKPTSLVPENSICHEIDTGKHFYFSNGEWKELPPKGGSGGEGGGTVEPFFVAAAVDGNNVTFDKTFAQTKAAIEAGQEVYLTFEGLSYPLHRFAADNDPFASWIVGDVDERQEIDMAEESGETVGWISNVSSGGGAEKFVVTLTESNDTWTANKTVDEIVAAKDAGQEVEAHIVLDMEPPITVIAQPAMILSVPNEFAAASFYAVFEQEQGSPKLYNAVSARANEEEWFVTETMLGNSSNAPMIVTLTLDESTGNFVGNKTFSEIAEAALDGDVILDTGYSSGSAATGFYKVMSITNGSDGDDRVIMVAFYFGAASKIITARGLPNDDFAFTLS